MPFEYFSYQRWWWALLLCFLPLLKVNWGLKSKLQLKIVGLRRVVHSPVRLGMFQSVIYQITILFFSKTFQFPMSDFFFLILTKYWSWFSIFTVLRCLPIWVSLGSSYVTLKGDPYWMKLMRYPFPCVDFTQPIQINSHFSLWTS